MVKFPMFIALSTNGLIKGEVSLHWIQDNFLKTIQKSWQYVCLIDQVFLHNFPRKQKEWYHLHSFQTLGDR